MIRTLSLLLVVVTVTGCTWRDRANDYRQASLSSAIVLPQGIQSNVLHDSYQVPGIESHQVLPGEFKVPRPDPLVKDSDLGVVRIQKMGEDRWVLLDGSPGQIWPRIRGFLSLAGFEVAHTDAVNGLIETVFVKPKGDAAPERYRFRIEQGVQRGTSEIYVLQSNNNLEWPSPRSSSVLREQEMTMALAQYLADTEAQSSVSMLVERNSETGGRIFLEKDKESSLHFIRILLSQERAWASVQLSLEKAGFVIEDMNRSEGRYWVKVLEDDDDDRIRWFYRYIDDLDDIPEQYLIEVKAIAPNEVRVWLKPQDAKEDIRAVEERILKQLKAFIS